MFHIQKLVSLVEADLDVSLDEIGMGKIDQQRGGAQSFPGISILGGDITSEK